MWTDLGLRWKEIGRENGTGLWRADQGVGRGLCCATDVSIMEATDLAKRHDAARLGPFDEPHVWRVLVEREMSPCTVIVREIRGESAT